MDEIAEKPDFDPENVVNFDYIKSNHFRTITPNGMLASATSVSGIQIAFFTERIAIPRRVTHECDDDGSLGKIIDTVSRESIVREVEVVVALDEKEAKILLEHLNDLLEQAKSHRKEEEDA